MDTNSKIKIDTFIDLYKIFNERGFSLYMVGGTVRDYLLHIPLDDMDLVSDATPDDIRMFFPHADYSFERFGSVKLIFKNIKFDITTLRKEEDYIDYRHPLKVIFSKELKEDVIRRDFTINALYMDHNLNLIDYVNGEEDIKNKIIRMVGNPYIRIKEDPLRILRALRFKDLLSFSLDKELELAIKENKELIKKLNKEKINQEIRKSSSPESLKKSLKDLGVLC